MFSGLLLVDTSSSERQSSSSSSSTGTGGTGVSTRSTGTSKPSMSSSSGGNNNNANSSAPPRHRGHNRHSSLGSLDTITTAINSVDDSSLIGSPPVARKRGGGGGGGGTTGRHRRTSSGGGGSSGVPSGRSRNDGSSSRPISRTTRGAGGNSHVRHDSVDTVQTGNTTMDTVVRSLDLADMGQVAEMLAMEGSLNNNGSGGGGGGGQGPAAASTTPHNYPTPTATGNSSKITDLLPPSPGTPTPPRRGGSSSSHSHRRSNSGGGGGGPMDASLPPSAGEFGSGGTMDSSPSMMGAGSLPSSLALPSSSSTGARSLNGGTSTPSHRRSNSGGGGGGGLGGSLASSRSFEYTPPRSSSRGSGKPSPSPIIPPASPSEAALSDLIVHGVQRSLTPRGNRGGTKKNSGTANSSSSTPSLSSFGTGRATPSRLSHEDDPNFRRNVVEKLRVELDALLPLLVSNRRRDAPAIRGLFSNLEDILRSYVVAPRNGGAEVLHLDGERSVTVEVIEMGRGGGEANGGGGGGVSFTCVGGVLPPLPHDVCALLSRVVLVAAMRLDEHWRGRGSRVGGGGGGDESGGGSNTGEWARPALDFWIAACRHLQPDLIFAILRYPLGRRGGASSSTAAAAATAGLDDDLRTMFSVLADVVLRPRGRDDGSAVVAGGGEDHHRGGCEWYEDPTRTGAFVALTHSIRVAELAETRLCAPLSPSATATSSTGSTSMPSILGTPLDVVLGSSSRDILMKLGRCAAAGIVAEDDGGGGGSSRLGRRDVDTTTPPPRGSCCASLLASVLRMNLLDVDDFGAALGRSGSSSDDDGGGVTPMETDGGGSPPSSLELPRLTTALVRSIRRFFESSSSSSSGRVGREGDDEEVENCAMSSLSLVALLLDSSLVDINSTTLYGDATMDHLLTTSFASSAKDSAAGTTFILNESRRATLRALDDVCRCNASTGGLTVLRSSSKSMGHTLRRGWKAILSLALRGGGAAMHVDDAGGREVAAASNAIACLRVMHDHCPSQVRQALLDVATRQARAATTAAATRDLEDSENSGILGNNRTTGGVNDVSTKATTRYGGGGSTTTIVTIETIWDKLGSTLLALTCHENIETSSNAAGLLARLLQGPPPSSSRVKTTSTHRQDEISRGLWNGLEEDGGGVGGGHDNDDDNVVGDGQGWTCSAREIVTVLQHIVRLFRMVEVCHRGSTMSSSYGTRGGMDFGDDGDGAVRNGLLLARGNDHDVIIGTVRVEPRLCSALDVAAFILQSERCMDHVLRYNHAVVVAETSKGGGGSNNATNKERDLIDVLGQIACCQISMAGVLPNKEIQSSLPSKDDLHIVGARSNGLGCMVSLGASFLLSRLGYTNLPCNASSSVSSDSREEARYDQQLSARKSLRGCLFHGSSPSSITTNGMTKSYQMKLNGVFRHSAAQPYSRDLTKRAMQLYVELQGTTRENVSFCADALFSSHVRKHHSTSKLVEKVQSEQGEIDKLRRTVSSLSTELDILKSAHQRKATAWERELHHAETRAEADATEMIDRCTREREGAERRAKACQRALSQMKVALEEMERGKNEIDAELTRTRARADRAQADVASHAQKAADLQTSLEQEREERQSKENVLRSTLQDVTNLKDQMTEICAGRTEVENKLASSEKELDSVRCSKGEAEARIEDAYAKLIGLAEAYKQKESRVKALEAELDEAARNSNSKLNAAVKRCALAESRESDLKSENELLREKLLQMKQSLKDASGQGHRAAAAYRSSRM